MDQPSPKPGSNAARHMVIGLLVGFGLAVLLLAGLTANRDTPPTSAAPPVATGGTPTPPAAVAPAAGTASAPVRMERLPRISPAAAALSNRRFELLAPDAG